MYVCVSISMSVYLCVYVYIVSFSNSVYPPRVDVSVPPLLVSEDGLSLGATDGDLPGRVRGPAPDHHCRRDERPAEQSPLQRLHAAWNTYSTYIHT